MNEKLPWFKVTLAVHNLQSGEEAPIRTLYLYEEDKKDFEAFITTKKTKCTVKEMGLMFEYLCEKHKDLLSTFDFNKKEKEDLAKNLAKSKWLEKAIDNLIKEFNTKKL